MLLLISLSVFIFLYCLNDHLPSLMNLIPVNAYLTVSYQLHFQFVFA